MENSFLKNLKNELPYDPAFLGHIPGHIPIPRHIPRRTYNLKRYVYHNVHCSTIYNSQDIKAT